MSLSIKEQILILASAIFLTFYELFKSFLPMNLIPRKSVYQQNVLITGSGSGIGRIMAQRFALLGANVILWDINVAGNRDTHKLISELGFKSYPYTVDLSDRKQINQTAEKVKQEVGDVDILVNNAGYVSGKLLIDITDDEIARTMAVNTTAHLYTTKSFLPSMLEKNSGHIVNIASVAGKIGCPRMTDYCASKHGAVGFHEALTAELHAMGKRNIQTTLVCPYFIDTGMFNGFKPSDSSLLPALTPDYVVDCIMEAVLTNRYTIAIPKFNYVLSIANAVLPTRVTLLLGGLFGSDHCMDEFTGRVAN